MPSIGEARELGEVEGEPRCGLGQMDEAVLDPRVEPGDRGRRVDPHDLVGLRPVAGGGVHPLVAEFLDQLGARDLVLDQDDIGPLAPLLVLHPALQFRVVEALAHDIEQIKVLGPYAPARADAEIRKFGRPGLRGCNPIPKKLEFGV